ncbi:nitronate monooxygenase, partial [Alicyclobacillaceae bacterium I2511]
PEPVLRRLEGTSVRKLGLVASVRQAKKAESVGADAVMAVGQEGGGHIGREDTGTLVLVPRVVDAVKIPVVASGGIADGRQWVAAMALGAAGIEMGTRFVATKECMAHPAYKNAIVQGTETDTRVIERSIGAPGRVVRTPWADEILRQEVDHPTPEELYPYISGERNRRAIWEGKLEEGFGWAGQSMGLIHDVPSVAELFAELLSAASAAMGGLREAFRDISY